MLLQLVGALDAGVPVRILQPPPPRTLALPNALRFALRRPVPLVVVRHRRVRAPRPGDAPIAHQ